MTILPSLNDGQSPLAQSDSFERERERIHRQMLSSVSHDLKTPLASIIGSLEIFDRMKDKLPEDKKLSLVLVALQEAYRLDNFITNILDMAKLENGMVKARHEKTEIGGLIRDCLLRLKSLLQTSQVAFDPTGQLTITTDAVLLSRTVCLVLDNAVKYGGVQSTIDITYGQNGGEGYICIRDNGRGVPPEQLDDIFSKYTRLAKEDQQKAGTGLGLSIGKAIMNLLDGDLQASNHVDGGMLFTLTFPTELQVP